jgi:ZipA, C-terminal FtsZ-binding domain
MQGGFHRFDGELVSQAEWAQMPDTEKRILRALGPEPLDDFTHLLAPLPLPESALVVLSRTSRPALELKLVARGAPFSAREVWRALHSLGLRWGNLDLFHWGDPARFSVSALGLRPDFLPERAIEGEGVAGLCLSFEPDSEPLPLEVLERMALALAFLRETLGGEPCIGEEALDAERLEWLRVELG